MAGLIAPAPLYVNGVLSLLFVFVAPGLALVSALNIPSFPQRWLVVFLGSVVTNYLMVTLIAAFHLDPLLTYRIAALLLVGVPVAAAMARRIRAHPPAFSGGGAALSSGDLRWLLAGVLAVALAYFNVWKHGVPNVFDGGDVSINWNGWALIWSQGLFPTASYGYPQFVPTLWAVTYIFMGSSEHYFAFYIYIGLITIPILLNAMNLGRISRWYPLISGLVFIWFVAEIREPWLRATLQEGFPDWVAAIFAFCGVVLFIANAPDGRLDREKIVAALSSLGLVSIAAATKPMYGLFAIAVFLGICADACKCLEPASRNRFLVGATAILALCVALYAVYYAHLTLRSMPSYPVTELSERLARAIKLLNANFTRLFQAVFLLGLLLSPFVKRVRWLSLSLFAGVGVWANTASYDLRNVLGFLLVAAFIPLYVAARARLGQKMIESARSWRVADGAVAAVLAAGVVGLTSALALSNDNLGKRFADDQLRAGPGLGFNQAIQNALQQGCTLFTSSSYPLAVTAFQRFRGQIQFFSYTLPLDRAWASRLEGTSGCAAIFYPLELTHPSILSFIGSYVQAHNLKKVHEGIGMELLVSER